MIARRSGTLFALGLALLGLHVVDDALVSLEPGVSAGDHLASGGATLALLAAAAFGWAHLAAGWRAVIALTLVAPTLAGFGLAVSHASAGAAGDDWTGFLLAPAGLALLAAGAAELWRSRSGEGRVALRRSLQGLGALLYAFWVVVPLTFAIVATHRPRDAAQPLRLGGPATSVTLRTADGLDLAASYVRSRNGAAVILFPRRGGTDRQARLLAAHGYGVLSVDMRGYGASEGDPNAFGWGATADIDAAVAWLRGRREVRPGAIGGLGLSVGGEQMLEAAAGNPALRAVVSEGAGERSIRESAIRGASGALALPQQAVLTASLRVLSGRPVPPGLDDAARRIAPRAVLLVHGEQGNAGEELTPDFYAAARRPKELWLAPGGHTDAIAAAPAEYERRVLGFLGRHLRVPES